MAKNHPLAAVTRIALTTALLLLAIDVGAEEWTFPGARYQAMGGAGVAVVDDNHAAYWNPGALAFETSEGIELPFSFSTATLGDALSDADDIANFVKSNSLVSVLTKVAGGSALSTAELRNLLSLAVARFPNLGDKGEGFLALPEVGMTLRRGRLAITLRGSGSLGLDPVLDLANLSFSDALSAAAQVTNVVGAGVDRSGAFANPGSQTLANAIATAFAAWTQNQAEEFVFQAEQVGLNTTEGSIRNLITTIAEDTGGLTALDLARNGSGVRVSGLLTQEIGIAYAFPVHHTLGIGGQLRYIRGVSTSHFIQFDDIKDGRDLVNELTDLKAKKSSERVGLDLGVLFRPNDRWRIGVVGRNLNGPDFELSGPGSYKIDPQVRVGVALNVASNWVFAADVDVTENDSDAIDGFKSRLLSVGTEYRVGSGDRLGIALRAGAYTNLASEQRDSFTLTGGVGLHLGRVQLDLAVGLSPNFEHIEAGDSKLPSQLKLSGSLRWVTRF